MIREPAVAGTFYPGVASRLRQDVEKYLLPSEAKQEVLGVVSPHAGYMYSGHVAGAVLSRVEIPDRIIVLCPNHTGAGAYAAINEYGSWRTPLGEVSIDSHLARRLVEIIPWIEEDSVAHRREHALEVQLPFLQVLHPGLRFVPLCLSHLRLGECRSLGEGLAQLIQESDEKILLLASSDMNHYESQERTLVKDQRAIDRILALDPDGLYRCVHEEQISMCGIIPTTCMLVAAKKLGASQAELIKHATSGDITGDTSAVVGYAGIVVR